MLKKKMLYLREKEYESPKVWWPRVHGTPSRLGKPRLRRIWPSQRSISGRSRNILCWRIKDLLLRLWQWKYNIFPPMYLSDTRPIEEEEGESQDWKCGYQVSVFCWYYPSFCLCIHRTCLMIGPRKFDVGVWQNSRGYIFIFWRALTGRFVKKNAIFWQQWVRLELNFN